jgi:hypothetical protein
MACIKDAQLEGFHKVAYNAEGIYEGKAFIVLLLYFPSTGE